MKIIFPIFKKDFVNYEDIKKAFLTSSKYVASKIISVGLDKNTIWQQRKISDTTIELTVYGVLDDEKEFNSFCSACKEFHSSFFINDNYNCSSCQMLAFRKRIQGRMLTAKGYYKGKKLE